MLAMRTAPRRGFILPILGIATLILVGHDLLWGRALDESYRALEDNLRNTVPTILELSEMSRQLDRLDAELSTADSAPLDAPTRARAALALEQVEHHRRAYLALPASPWERGEQGALGARVDALSALLRPVLVSSAGTPDRETTVRCSVEVQGAKESIAGLTRLNVLEAKEREHEASLSRQSASRWGLVTLGYIVALIAALGVLMDLWLRAFDGFTRSLALEIDGFAARLAYELGTPLAPALLVLGAVRREKNLEHTSLAAVQRAEDGLRRASVLADGFLAFGRAAASDIQQPRAESQLESVVRYVEWRLQPAMREHHARVTFDLEERGLRVVMSEVALATIVSAFVHERLRSCGPGALVRVRARRERGVVALIVEDRGPPIAPEVVSILESTPHGGSLAPEHAGPAEEPRTGVLLALARARHLVEAYGGTLAIRSGADQGTVFTIRLRAAPSARAVAESGPLDVERGPAAARPASP